jgi:hypothetical protein
MLGEDRQAMKLLGQSQDELTKANLNTAHDWARFYDRTDMLALVGTVHNELSNYDRRHTPIAIAAFEQALARYDETMKRSRTFALTILATAHLREDNVHHGVQIGHRALRTACNIRSKRVSDRMEPLEIEAIRQSHNADSHKLSRSIRKYRDSCHRQLKIKPPCSIEDLSMNTKGPARLVTFSGIEPPQPMS